MKLNKMLAFNPKMDYSYQNAEHFLQFLCNYSIYWQVTFLVAFRVKVKQLQMWIVRCSFEKWNETAKALDSSKSIYVLSGNFADPLTSERPLSITVMLC